MHLPIQSEPVQRTSLGQPIPGNSVDRSGAGEHGIQPSGFWDDVTNAVRGVGQVAQAGGPLLGALGSLF